MAKALKHMLASQLGGELENSPAGLMVVDPGGMTVEAVVSNEPGTTSLQQAIVSCDWVIEVLGSSETDIRAAVADVLAADELPMERVRKGKTTVTDVRPAILHLEVTGPTADGVELKASLATESVSLRPAELVEAIGTDLVEGRVRRTHQWLIVDGTRCEPVSPPGLSTRHEFKRAS